MNGQEESIMFKLVFLVEFKHGPDGSFSDLSVLFENLELLIVKNGG